MLKPTLEVVIMGSGYIEKVLNNTRTVAEQWDIFTTQCEDVDAFMKAFHLRPKSDGVTVVSTLEYKPMRGAHSAKTKLAQFLKELYTEELHLANKNDTNNKNAIKVLTQKKFKDRITSKQKKVEESYQAKMIISMSENIALKSFLNVDNLLFISSEFILHPQSDKRKRLRVDILGYDGLGKIFFFELKAPGNKKDKPDEQVVKYLDRYSIDRREETIDVLSNYPINSLKTRDVEFHGYAVYGYSEKLDTANSKPFKSIEEPGIISFICKD